MVSILRAKTHANDQTTLRILMQRSGWMHSCPALCISAERSCVSIFKPPVTKNPRWFLLGRRWVVAKRRGDIAGARCQRGEHLMLLTAHPNSTNHRSLHSYSHTHSHTHTHTHVHALSLLSHHGVQREKGLASHSAAHVLT